MIFQCFQSEFGEGDINYFSTANHACKQLLGFVSFTLNLKNKIAKIP